MRLLLGVAAIAAAGGLVWPSASSAQSPPNDDRDVTRPGDPDTEDVDFEGEARFWAFDRYGQSIVIGRPFGDHVSLLTGVSVSVLSLEQGSDDYGWIELRIPVELKVSLRRPAAGAIVPIVRASVWLSHTVPIDPLAETTRGLGVGLFGGATYFFSPSFGAGIEAGLGIERQWMGESSAWLLGTSWRGHFVLRV
ncbi:MAG: hypothetical protein IT379_01185 [Deltaproteobacteria bacterium]|nr:hypothetical protein [Deltaproteobacteria bacterium]